MRSILAAYNECIAAYPSNNSSPQTGLQVCTNPTNRYPLWLWPHLLSLDAPAVSVLWQVLLVRSLGLPIDVGTLAVSALCVWFVYIADRILDAQRLQTAGWQPARRVFYRLHKSAAFIVALLLFVTIPPLAYHWLNQRTFYAGLALSVLTIVYFVLVHLVPAGWRRYWPREAVVAGIFSFGSFLSVWNENYVRGKLIVLATLLFAILCWSNLCTIETWEWQVDPDNKEGKPNSSTSWIAHNLLSIGMLTACLAAVLGLVHSLPAIFAGTSCLSGFAFVILSVCRSCLPINGMPVAMDLALCTPLLSLIFR